MDNYLIDRETLGRFIDELIKKKPLPVDSVEELAKWREEKIHALDDKIGMAIFTRFTKPENEEFNRLLDENAPEEAFDRFFEKCGVDLNAVMTETMQTFAEDFLGGKDA